MWFFIEKNKSPHSPNSNTNSLWTLAWKTRFFPAHTGRKPCSLLSITFHKISMKDIFLFLLPIKWFSMEILNVRRALLFEFYAEPPTHNKTRQANLYNYSIKPWRHSSENSSKICPELALTSTRFCQLSYDSGILTEDYVWVMEKTINGSLITFPGNPSISTRPSKLRKCCFYISPWLFLLDGQRIPPIKAVVLHLDNFRTTPFNFLFQTSR